MNDISAWRAIAISACIALLLYIAVRFGSRWYSDDRRGIRILAYIIMSICCGTFTGVAMSLTVGLVALTISPLVAIVVFFAVVGVCSLIGVRWSVPERDLYARIDRDIRAV